MSNHLCHTIFQQALCVHTTLSHTIFQHTLYLRFMWQARHLATSTFVLRGRRGTRRHLPSVLRGRRGTYGTGVMALGDIHLFVSRGRRGTWRHLPSFCVAGVALMALGGAFGSVLIAGDAGDAAALCVAGTALGDIYLRFTWQARHLATSTFVLRGRRGTYGTGVMALGDIHLFVSRGRRGTWRHPPLFHVAGAALGDIYLRFAWQAWHLFTGWRAWIGFGRG